MNNDLLNISLKQGKQFNSYQTKIKQNIGTNKSKKNISRKEGFVSLEQNKMGTNENTNENANENTNENTNENDINELTKLQTRYNELMQQYSNIQQKISNSSSATIDRVSSDNPYLGKNLQFTDGTIVYVTNVGIVKPYTSEEIFNGTINKNGCPKEIVKLTIPWTSEYIQGAKIPTNPTLIVGSNMIMGQSCGFEGKNVYASNMINNPSSKYIGCYNDTPPSTNINVVPIMNSSNSVNGFASGSSSVYLGDPTSGAGPWTVFDQNPNTFWHSEVSSATNYNSTTGMYEGSNGVNIINIGMVSGEFIQINMPGVNTSSVQNTTVNQYSISPRSDSNTNITTRSPNSWTVIGFKDSQWNQVDRQVNQSFTNSMPKVYNVAFPGAYGAYILLIDRVGNNDQTNNRYCVQVAEWNLFSNSDDNFSDDKRAMTLINGYTTFEKCQEYAANNGYNLFGLQNVQTDGTASCAVSKDITRTQIYGDASVQTTSIPMWSSNTSSNSGATCTVSADGRFIINDSSGLLWQTSDSLPDCWYAGYVNPDSIQGSWGGNCVGKPLNIDCGNPHPTNSYGTTGIVGNLNTISQNQASKHTSWGSTPQANWSFNPMSEFTGGDPAVCCAKLVDYSYQCGGGAFKKGQISGGSNINYDCSAEVSRCTFFLFVQNDGNICLFRGTPENFMENIWCSKTSGKQKEVNPNWVSSKGKYGRSYLNLNETLGPGEWIGSDDGSLKLIMQTDGNLVLYTSNSVPGCKVINDKTYGGKSVNAVYELESIGNKATLGNIGYVDSDSNIRQYPSSMIEFTNDYQIYQQMDLPGNDLTNMSVTDQKECQTMCDNNLNCAAYVYNSKSQMCFLKNNTTENKQQHNDGVLGIRQKKPINSNSCSNQIINIDTIQYDNYKNGDEMTSDTQCRNSIISQEEQKKYGDIISQLNILGNDIVLKMEKLYNQNNNNFKELNINSEQFKKDLEKYKLTNLRIQKNINGLQNFQSNNIEGMQNLSNSLDFNDLNGMLSDSDLRVLQENYTYIMWSILAVGILTITINTMKK